MTLITVPNEFDASARARVLLADLGIVRGDEETGAVRGVLTAAGLTYVAAAVTSAMWLLYMAWPLLAGNNSDD
jgi:Zn-dependent membrane protease YugP